MTLDTMTMGPLSLSLESAAALVIAALILGYLVYSLLRPERF